MVENAFEHSYAATQRIAAVRAAIIVRAYQLPIDARHDLEQEALFELWRKFPLFDIRRAGWNTFAEHVIASRLTSLMRRHSSLCRRHGKEALLNEIVRSMPAPAYCIDLRADIKRVLASVPPFDRAVALSLINSSAIETGRHLGVARATVYRAIKRLRVAFTAAGYAGKL